MNHIQYTLESYIIPKEKKTVKLLMKFIQQEQKKLTEKKPRVC